MQSGDAPQIIAALIPLLFFVGLIAGTFFMSGQRAARQAGQLQHLLEASQRQTSVLISIEACLGQGAADKAP